VWTCEALERKNPFLLKITVQDRGVSQGGYVNLLPFVRGEGGYLGGYSGGCQQGVPAIMHSPVIDDRRAAFLKIES